MNQNDADWRLPCAAFPPNFSLVVSEEKRVYVECQTSRISFQVDLAN